jgi:hypothetical protein
MKTNIFGCLKYLGRDISKTFKLKYSNSLDILANLYGRDCFAQLCHSPPSNYNLFSCAQRNIYLLYDSSLYSDIYDYLYNVSLQSPPFLVEKQFLKGAEVFPPCANNLVDFSHIPFGLHNLVYYPFYEISLRISYMDPFCHYGNYFGEHILKISSPLICRIITGFRTFIELTPIQLAKSIIELFLVYDYSKQCPILFLQNLNYPEVLNLLLQNTNILVFNLQCLTLTTKRILDTPSIISRKSIYSYLGKDELIKFLSNDLYYKEINIP